MAVARADLGLAEIPGKDTLPQIRRWLVQAGAWWHDDETPWCGTWLNHVFEDGVGLEGPQHAYRARAWLSWGVGLGRATLGCVAVLNGGPRRPGGGHVGLVAGRDRFGNLMLIGGNQGNRVSIAPFARDRVLQAGLRWPDGHGLRPIILPVYLDSGRVSTFEA